MYSELECGVCYRTYNGGRRCPRELHCKHSFCESCLLALARPPGPDGAGRLIACPLCRHTTSISGDGSRVRAELRVDESALERLLVSGVLDRQVEDEEEEVEEEEDPDQGGCDAAPPETPAEESDNSTGSRGGKLRRCCRKVWRCIIGESPRQRGGEICMTHDDLRSLTMMSCHML